MIDRCLASKGALMIVVSVAVSVGATRFEETRVIYGPVAGLASFRKSVIVTTAIFISIKGQTGGLATNCPTAASVKFQFFRTIVVDVIHTRSFLTAVLATIAYSIEGCHL